MVGAAGAGTPTQNGDDTMSDHEIDTLVAASNPLDERALAAIDEVTLLELADALVGEGDALPGETDAAVAAACRAGAARSPRVPGRRGSGSARVAQHERHDRTPTRGRPHARGRLPRRHMLAVVAVAAVAVAAVFAVTLRDPGESGHRLGGAARAPRGVLAAAARRRARRGACRAPTRPTMSRAR